jgi:ABC-type lipoprotein export system ATPase subunit
MPPEAPNPFAESPPPLLSFSNVSKSYPDGGRRAVLFEQISFELTAGATAGIYGPRRSGKSTLLHLAAAIEPPDAGVVAFAGRDLTRISALERARLLRSSVALLSSADWLLTPGETAVDHVALSLGSKGLTSREARRRALATLDAVDVSAVGAAQSTVSLSHQERARVMLARALVGEPRLLLVDEPAPMPNLSDRERFCATLRAIASERGIALLVASEDRDTLGGMGAVGSISLREIVWTGERGTVVQGPWRAAASGPA